MDDKKLNKANNESISDQLISLRRLSYALLGGNLFCLVILFGPDAMILSANSELQIPVIDSRINAKAFLILFPLCLIFFSVYSQLLINAYLKSKRSINEKVEIKNFKTQNLFRELSGSNCISIIIFYLLTPFTLITLSWKSLPRPESVFLIPVTILFITGIIFLRIWQVKEKVRFPAYLAAVWIGVSSIFIFVYILQHNLFPDKLRSFRNIDLVMADLQKSDLRNVYLPNAKMDHVLLDSANMEKANLISAKLKSAQLNKAILKNACLDHARLEGAILENADLRNATLKNANLIKTNFQNADLSNANLFYADLHKADLKKSKLHGASFHKAVLHKAKLNNAEMEETDLRWAYLDHADLSSVDAPGANFSLAKLPKAILIKAKLMGAILRATKLDETNLTNADLSDADLSCAILKKATLKGVMLQDAILKNADFQDADISKANLMGADLRGARNLTCTQLKSARNWWYASRDKSLKCEDEAPESYLEEIDDYQECDELRYKIINEIDKINK